MAEADSNSVIPETGHITVPTLGQKLVAEVLGSCFLYGTVIGSGIMADSLSGGNVAVALLGNTLATGAILYVLITIFLPISGAHMNPAVTMVMRLRGELTNAEAVMFVLSQLAGGIAGVLLVHAMFEQDIMQLGATSRTGTGQWIGEVIATFGLLLTILGSVRFRPEWIAPAVALYISSAIWFTSSTCFANPGITVARALTDGFTGIAATDVPMFVVMQLLGALLAWGVGRYLFDMQPG